MMLTPQARRRITGAIRSLEDTQARDRWGAWTQTVAPNEVRNDVPYDIAVIAYDALSEDARRIEARLGTEGLDEDLEADLLNDLGYIQAIETALRNEGIGR
jgi:hypothetical protein